MGANDTVIKERLKQLKKSFKEKKTNTATEDFIDQVVETYLDIFLKAEDSAIQDNPLSSKELDLIGKIRKNIQIYLTNFKPVETIASINIKLKTIEEQNKEFYDNPMQELKKLSSQNEILSENLNILSKVVENMLEEIKIFSKGKKVKDTVSFNELIDIKIAFKDANYKEKSFDVGEKYTIEIQADSKIAFKVEKIGVNFEPLDALVAGKKIVLDSQKEGYYIFNLPEAINCSACTTLVGSVTIKGPKISLYFLIIYLKLFKNFNNFFLNF